MVQALKLVAPIRAKAKAEPSHAVAALSAAATSHMPASAALREPLTKLLAGLPAPTADVTAAAAPAAPEEDGEKAAEKKPVAKVAENEVLVGLMALLLLLDTGKAEQVCVCVCVRACVRTCVRALGNGSTGRTRHRARSASPRPPAQSHPLLSCAPLPRQPLRRPTPADASPLSHSGPSRPRARPCRGRCS